jgi:hypothetical protein
MAIALTPAQIAQYAANAGFTGSALNTAVAIALAESSGNPTVVGDTNITPGGSVGLWQINLAAHPQYTAAELQDPQANADAAYAVYQQSGGFTPWTTFNTGAYVASLPSTALSTDVGSIDLSDEESSLADSLGIDPNVLLIGGIALVVVGMIWMES